MAASDRTEATAFLAQVNRTEGLGWGRGNQWAWAQWHCQHGAGLRLHYLSTQRPLQDPPELPCQSQRM